MNEEIVVGAGIGFGESIGVGFGYSDERPDI